MRELQRFPELYKKSTSNGKISVWKIWVEGSTIHTEAGYLGQKMKSSKDTVAKGKNIGRSNETTPHEQAVLEAKSKHQKYQDKGYHTDLKAVETGKASEMTPVPRPMLAQDFTKHGHKMKYPLAIQPKLDGARAVFTNGKFYSRNGKALADLPELAYHVESIFGKGVVVDGEIYADGLKDNFEEIMSAAKKVKGPNPKASLLEYHVYDLVEECLCYEARFHKIKSAFRAYKKCSVKMVETITVHNGNEVKAAHRLFLNKGYEGSMLRQPEATYEVDKRSYGLQKYKPVDDSEFRIVGIKEGRGSLAGSAVFILEIDDEHGKRTFDAVMTGTGAREFMKKCFTNHKLWKGKWMQVHYFGLTNKEKVPRFPRGKKIRDVE